MASAEEIAALRLLIAEPTEDPYTDEALGALIDASGSVKGAAAEVWTQKAASYATLVNVSESGSSRNLGDLQKNALAMAKTFAADVEEVATESTGIRIRRIVRR